MISTLARWRATWLSVPGIGSKTLQQLAARSIAETGLSEAQALAAAWDDWQTSTTQSWTYHCLDPVQQIKLAEFSQQTDPEELFEGWHNQNVCIWSDQDPDYPQLLKPLADRPQVLFVKGTWPRVTSTVAMVGTRRPTWYGEVMTERLVGDLLGQSICLVSGAMVGIDSLVHEAALAHQLNTVGVLGYGFDYCYPTSQARLLAKIIEAGGALVSEYPPTQAPQKHQFVMRNRIIAGLSQAVVVVEAAERSGTMITVEYALEYGRVVGAVPGPLTSQVSQGTAQLIRQGAACLTSGADLGFELGQDWSNSAGHQVSDRPTLDTPAKLNVWQALQNSGQPVDDLLKIAACPLAELLDVIGEWEEQGWIKNQFGMYTLAR